MVKLHCHWPNKWWHYTLASRCGRIYFGLQPLKFQLGDVLWYLYGSTSFLADFPTFFMARRKTNQPAGHNRVVVAFQLTQPTFLAPKGLEPLEARPGTKHQQEFAGSWWCPGAWEESSCGCLNKMRFFYFLWNWGRGVSSRSDFFFGGKGETSWSPKPVQKHILSPFGYPEYPPRERSNILFPKGMIRYDFPAFPFGICDQFLEGIYILYDITMA